MALTYRDIESIFERDASWRQQGKRGLDVGIVFENEMQRGGWVGVRRVSRNPNYRGVCNDFPGRNYARYRRRIGDWN